MTNPVILTFVAHYLPGYKSGGPLRTIANMVDQLGDEFTFWIVTQDRDALDTSPYPGVVADQWNRVGKAEVLYLSPERLRLFEIARLLSDTCHDVLYLNSFLEPQFTVLPLLARKLGLAPRRPCVIAPRGEFSAGAIALKAWKKRPYLWLTKFLGLYKGLHWQASSVFELRDIEREFGVDRGQISVAPDLPPCAARLQAESVSRKPGPLRIVFLSRISRMKNLEYFLIILQRVTAQIDFAIYGPLDDKGYWVKCKRLIQELPANIVVHEWGEVAPENVPMIFSEHDVFFFPTRGENYGHVIFESLLAGTCVVLSDKTPWKVDKLGAVELISLEEPEVWRETVERWARYSSAELAALRDAALSYAWDYMETSPAVEQNRALFQFAHNQAVTTR